MRKAELKQHVSIETKKALTAVEEMWAQVDKLREKIIGDTADERPVGSFTVEEYCIKYKISESTGRRHIDKFFKSGLVDRVYVRIPDTRGAIQRTSVYRFIKKPAK